jgi:hypothetical protein
LIISFEIPNNEILTTNELYEINLVDARLKEEMELPEEDKRRENT